MNMVKTDMAAYYAARASHYEEIYDKPERQAELALLHEKVRDTLRGHDVLELACGTGYWTAQFAPAAASVLATDISPEVLAVARAKGLPVDQVRFALGNAFALDLEGKY